MVLVINLMLKMQTHDKGLCRTPYVFLVWLSGMCTKVQAPKPQNKRNLYVNKWKIKKIYLIQISFSTESTVYFGLILVHSYTEKKLQFHDNVQITLKMLQSSMSTFFSKFWQQKLILISLVKVFRYICSPNSRMASKHSIRKLDY